MSDIVNEVYTLSTDTNWKAFINNVITDYYFRLVITYCGKSMHEGLYRTYRAAKIALSKYEKGWVKQECTRQLNIAMSAELQ